tara:strand:- start:92 stop:811 length:720 start_codon:yes stop_codon:yes gene_type:complete
MIWHFSDLGMENSLFTCYDGSVNEPDCKLDTKPQPQWVDNWLGNDNRREIYENWSRIIDLKINEDVFEGNYSITSGGLTPIIYIWDDNIASSELKNVVIFANFDVVDQSITPYFPYTGTWYDLMDSDGDTSINVSSTTEQINLQPGEYRIYGNQASSTLSNNDFETNDLIMYPNPSQNYISFNKSLDLIEIFDISGKKVLSFMNSVENQNIDLSNLNSGYYIVKTTSKNIFDNKKLIIK